MDFYERYIQDFPEKVLEFSDWMGIPIEAHKISLSRLKSLLLDIIRRGLVRKMGAKSSKYADKYVSGDAQIGGIFVTNKIQSGDWARWSPLL